MFISIQHVFKHPLNGDKKIAYVLSKRPRDLVQVGPRMLQVLIGGFLARLKKLEAVDTPGASYASQ